MEDRLVKPDSKTAVWKIALVVAAIVVAISAAIVMVQSGRDSDPYVQEVLALDGDPQRGAAIFQMNCAGCHGVRGNGRVGPSLQDVSEHRSRASTIHQVISGDTPPMPQFQPSPETMADLLEYLETL